MSCSTASTSRSVALSVSAPGPTQRSWIRPTLATGTKLGPIRISEVWVEALSPVDRKRLTLALAVHYEVEEVLASTGLTSAAPPENVHSTSRGPLASGGSIYHADLVVEALAKVAGRCRFAQFIDDSRGSHPYHLV